MLQTLIFAYDPLKLELLLDTRKKFFNGPDGPVTVLCDPKHLEEWEVYIEIANKYDCSTLQFGKGNPYHSIRKYIKYVQILNSNVIFTRPFNFYDINTKFNDNEILYYALRYGHKIIGTQTYKTNYRAIDNPPIYSGGDIWRTEDFIKVATSEDDYKDDPGQITHRYFVAYDEKPHVVINMHDIGDSFGLYKQGKRINVTPWLFTEYDTEEVEIPYDIQWKK